MRELSPAARLKLEELANQPRASFKQRLALLQFQIVILLILYVAVRIMLKIPWLGRGLSKVVKLSREGPLYKLGVWLCRRLARVTMGRHAYAKPSLAPAVRVKKRTATAIEVKVVACVEINQCVGCTKSFLGDDVAALVPSSGEEPTSPRHRAGVASMAWTTNAP